MLLGRVSIFPKLSFLFCLKYLFFSKFSSDLYWVDSHNRELLKSSLSGGNKVRVASLGNLTIDNVFGLAISPRGALFVSVWTQGMIITVDMEKRSSRKAVSFPLGHDKMFALAYDGRSELQAIGIYTVKPALKTMCILCINTGCLQQRLLHVVGPQVGVYFPCHKPVYRAPVHMNHF